MKCRHCASELRLQFIDLGNAPPSNAYLTETTVHLPEMWYPLSVAVCTECWLVQTRDYAQRSELFSAEYAYFSSFSTTWLEHANRFVASMAARFELGEETLVVEIASNDGYLLQYVMDRGIPCLGIEPTAFTARAARDKGIEVIEEFFGNGLARRLVAIGKSASLIVANNVLAHVPDINDFIAGFSTLLKPDGVASFEFPHLLQLVKYSQFDTVYHEHFSYLSLITVCRIFEANGLTVFDVEELPTHGGSLRVYAQRSDTGRHEIAGRVDALCATEVNAGMTNAGFYARLQEKAERIKYDFLSFLIEARRSGKTVAAYGAAAKGNTLMNYAGIRQDLIRFVVDRNPAKQGKFMPGSHIPIVDEEFLRSNKPEYVVIFPWNLAQEIVQQLEYVGQWGGNFVTAIPELRVSAT